jgi:hypothetical protein
MKKILIVLVALCAGVSVAQLQSSVIKNTAGEEVFSVNYSSGVATAKVAVVEATTLVGAVSSAQSSVTVSGATGIVSTAAALAAPTNAATAGLRVRINGTNYVIAVYPN